MSEPPSVFAGLRVLDLSTRLSGAFCARLFADWGAEVVLGEPPEGHPLRAEAPFLGDLPGAERSLLHLYANAGKRSIALRPGGADLENWLRWADVAVTSEPRPRFAELRALQPRITQISLTAHGQGGPLADAPGCDLTAYALSGWASINGTPLGPPLQGIAHQVGYLAGLCAFVGGAAAVRERENSGGEGQLVDVSELEALTAIAGPALLQAEYAGAVLPRRRPDMTRGPVPCRDGYFSATITRARFWRDVMHVLGLPDLAEDERYQSARYRREQRAQYTARVEERIRGWARWDLFKVLAEQGCIAGVVQDMKDVSECPQLAARGFFVPVQLADGRSAAFPGAPFRMSETPWRLRGGAPAQGTRAVPAAAPASREAPRAPARAAAPGCGPLSGVRAIVLTQAWSGSFATELLGALGADVIQIEPARRRMDSWRGGRGGAIPAAVRDGARRQRPWNCNPLFNSVNRNKRGLTLDLADPRGLELFRGLVRHADLVAENFMPRVLGNLGLDYESLRRIKPDVILGSLSAYGASGPYAQIPGIGATLEPMSGMSSLLGYAGGPPQSSGAMYPDPVSGYYFAAALILALHHRDRTGRGQHIDLGMLEACATFVGDALLEYQANGRVRPRLGNHHLRIAPHDLYPTRTDCWLAIAAQDESAWQALARQIERPELADDPRFADMAARQANQHELDEIISEWTLEQDAESAAQRLRACGVSAAPVLHTRQVPFEPQLRARGFFVEIDHPEAGRRVQTGVPWRFSRTPAAVTRPAPLLGQHGREILSELLGVSGEEYEELVRAGVTGEPDPPTA